jgi:hypothetical protein
VKPKLLKAAAGVFLLLCSCSFKKPPAFAFYSEGAGSLYALSKKAAEGVLPLSESRKLEYAFETPLTVGEDASFEVDYRIRFPGAGSIGSRGRIVLDLGELSWELPQDLSFLGISGELPALRYAVPLPAGKLEKIVVSYVPETPAQGAAPELEIRSMALEGRWYGFSGLSPDLPFKVTPFVYLRDSALVVDPPEQFRSRGKTGLQIGTGGGSLSVEGGQDGARGYFRIETSAAGQEFLVPPGFISFESYPLALRAGKGLRELRLAPAGTVPPEPITADPGIILAWPQDEWRDPRFEVFRWEGFPDILIFDMADYEIQDRFLKRLAFFTEKKGFRGRLAQDEEIAGLHGWNAHDYRAQSLADFFDAARKSDFPLLREERELESILVSQGVLRREGESIVPGQGALISVTRQSERYLRDLFMNHEGFHGLYFTDEEFRDFCKNRWEHFKDPGRRFILSYFDFQAYDIHDIDLVINEFMAHLLQQPALQAEKYFGENLPSRMISASPWRRASLPETEEVSPQGADSWPEIGAAFAAEAEAFSAYVNRRWGLAAGRVKRVQAARL